MILQSYREGQKIFSEGDSGDSAFLVETGLVEISRTVKGKKMVLGRIGPGGLFGEMALIDAQPRMADAQAVEKTKAFLVPTAVFKNQLDSSDPFMRKLVLALMNHARSLSGQLATANRMLATAAAHQAQSRNPRS